MGPIIYATGNQLKFSEAENFFKKHNIELIQQKLDTYEIQSFDSSTVTISKARQAWEQLRKPLFVNDTSWSIPALGGFPGPYMKYINAWLTSEDILNLMQNKNDRTIILRDTIVYIDENGTQVFSNDLQGTILQQAYVGECRHPSDAVVSLTNDGKSLAEIYSLDHRFFLPGEDIVWQDFVQWLQTT